MKLELEIPDSQMIEIAQSALNSAFDIGCYRSGIGANLIREIVDTAVSGRDFAAQVHDALDPLITGQLQQLIAAAVEKVVTDSVTDMVRKRVRQMRAAGQLDAAVDRAIEQKQQGLF